MQASDLTRKLRIRDNGGNLLTFFLIILALFIYDIIFNLNGSENAADSQQNTVDFQLLKTSLKGVYLQNEAVSVISQNLDNRNVVSVVNFIGSNGVGKTYTANIMKKHFSPSVSEFQGIVKPYSLQDFLNIVRGKKLVIFDDLTVDDVDNLLIFIKAMPQNISTLVICIFNIQETDSFLNYEINYDYVSKIEESFQIAGVAYKTAKFREFTTDETIGWVIKQLEMKGTSKELHGKIAESVLAGHDVKYHGLKGLSSKLNLEL